MYIDGNGNGATFIKYIYFFEHQYVKEWKTFKTYFWSSILITNFYFFFLNKKKTLQTFIHDELQFLVSGYAKTHCKSNKPLCTLSYPATWKYYKLYDETRAL